MFYVKHLKKYIYLLILAALVLVIAHETFSCVMWDPDPRPGIEPGPPAGGAQSFSHWAREVRVLNISKVMCLQLCAACDYQAMLNATETRSFCGACESTHPVLGLGAFYSPGLHRSLSPLRHRSKTGPQPFWLSSFAAAAQEQQERCHCPESGKEGLTHRPPWEVSKCAALGKCGTVVRARGKNTNAIH